jgi:hypothetical protein
MSATGTPTPNLGLRIPLGTDPAAVEDINYNAGVLDTKIGAIGNDTVKGLLDHAGDEINALGDGLAIIANGNTHAAIAAGEFVFVRNHGSLATGLYKATTAIAANGALSSSNLAADSKGGLNSLSDHIASLSNALIANQQYSGTMNGKIIDNLSGLQIRSMRMFLNTNNPGDKPDDGHKLGPVVLFKLDNEKGFVMYFDATNGTKIGYTTDMQSIVWT